MNEGWFAKIYPMKLTFSYVKSTWKLAMSYGYNDTQYTCK
jgi:hypothetical protein